MASHFDKYPAPSRDEIMRNFKERRNWGRWGDDDSVGAVNLITVEKRMAALASVQSGRTASLSRPYPKDPSALNPTPAQHFMRTFDRGDEGDGAVVDYYGFIYHGHTFTHVDALCHIWDSDGIWQGRDPDEAIDSATGATFADVTAWNQGIFTKAVLLDVPKHRGEPYVTLDQPVMGDELQDIADSQGVTVEPGDALLVYSGRETYQAANPDDFFGQPPSPGLHASCSIFIRDKDVSMLGWDMMDHRPSEYGLAWPVHGVIFSFGVVLLDNALLQPLAEACAEEGRYEMLLCVLPLNIQGGTGSPVNPIAVF
jgi:kynurenine formamidase